LSNFAFILLLFLFKDAGLSFLKLKGAYNVCTKLLVFLLPCMANFIVGLILISKNTQRTQIYYQIVIKQRFASYISSLSSHYRSRYKTTLAQWKLKTIPPHKNVSAAANSQVKVLVLWTP